MGTKESFSWYLSDRRFWKDSFTDHLLRRKQILGKAVSAAWAEDEDDDNDDDEDDDYEDDDNDNDEDDDSDNFGDDDGEFDDIDIDTIMIS